MCSFGMRFARFLLFVLLFTLACLTCSNADAGVFFRGPVARSPFVNFRQGFNAGVRANAFNQGFRAANGSPFIGSQQFIGVSPFRRQQFIGGPVFVHPSQIVVPQSFGFFAF